MKSAETACKARSVGLFWLRLMLDVLAAAVILAVIYFFLRIFPQVLQLDNMQESASNSPVPVVEAVYDSADHAADVSFHDDVPDGQGEPAPRDDSGQTAEIKSADESAAGNESGPSEGEKLPFYEKYSSFFTESAELEENSYSSPDLSIRIREVTDSEHGSQVFHAFIADVYAASVENLQAGFPVGHQTAEAEVIAIDGGAILAVNGDFYTNINKGFLVRNGTVLQSVEGTADLCVLYPDGSVKTFGPGEYSAEGILNQNPWQVWSFGPALLEKDGSPKTDFNTSSVIYNRNPRTAFGYYEPGHYCFVVIDGRAAGYSDGASIRTLAKFMADLGCKAAYNLDGGASSVMVFDGRVINYPSGGGRKLSDMVMICELPTAEIIRTGGEQER